MDHAHEPFDRFEHDLRTDRTVDADDVGAGGFERRSERLRRGAVGRAAIGADGDLRDHGEIASRTDRAECRFELIDVGECLQAEAVDAAREQAVDLPSERRFSFVAAERAERLESHTEWADRADDGAMRTHGASGPAGPLPR